MHSRDQNIALSVYEAMKSYSDFIGRIPAIFCEMTLEGKVIHVSDAVTAITGYSAKELVGRSIQDIFVSKTTRYQIREMGEKLLSGDVSDYEMNLLAKDGSAKTIAWTLSPRKNGNGTVESILGFGIDVTNRKRIEQQLTESEAKFRQLFNDVTDSIVLHELVENGMPGRFIEVNDVACRRSGYSRGELLQMSPEMWDAEERKPEIPGIMTDLLEKGQATFEMVNVTKDGKRIPVEVNAHVFEMNGRRVVLAISRDVSERKRAEAALRESEEKFRAIFANAAIGIALGNMRGRFIECNHAFQEMVGYSSEELYCRSFADITHPDDISSDMGLFEELKAGKRESFQIEKRYIRKDGEMIWVRLSASLVKDSEGNARFAIGLVEDITQKKFQENQLAYFAAHDSLTGLPNRLSLEDAMCRVTARARRGQVSTLLFMDLDDFKSVNDTLGHNTGDKALTMISRMLENQLRTSDLMARLGGDEFAVLLEDTAIDEGRQIAERMRKTIADSPLLLDGRYFQLGLSIGLAAIDGSIPPGEILSTADANMYKAKALGGNTVVT